jgi:hypothetical protein
MNKIMEKYKVNYIIMPSTRFAALKIRMRETPDSSLILAYLGISSVSIPLFGNAMLNSLCGLQIVTPRYCNLSLLKFTQDLAHFFK